MPLLTVSDEVRSVAAAFRRFWPYTRGDRRLLLFSGVCAVAAAVCEVAAIWLFGVITDKALAARDLDAFWRPALSWLALALAAGLVSFGGEYTTALAGERFLLRLRDGVFAHIQRMSPDFFDRRRLGDLMARLTDDIEAIEELVASGLVQAVTALVSVVFFAGAALYVRWDLALVACALVPLFVVTAKVFAARLHAAAARERASNGVMNSIVEEGLANQALVQSCNRQAAEASRLHREGRRWMAAKMAEARLTASYGPLIEVLETVCVLVVLGMGAWELSRDRLTLGGLLAFAAYLGYLYPQIQSLGRLALTAGEAAAGADRVMQVFDTRPEITDRPSARPRPAARGHVAFDAVTFGYPGTGRTVLDGLTFRTRPGDLVLVTGPSGSGKSTIAKLLLRFHDPIAGGIRLDGVPICDLTLHALRASVTLLAQESLLFSGTVRDNIAYGRPGASDADVVAAAKAAGAHDFITALPQGYDTPVGQRGRLLSGGQRQRIAIARAMIRNTPVVILDEPTTGLDEAAARRILAPLRRLMEGRTTILITHDPHLAPRPDQVIDLGAGAASPHVLGNGSADRGGPAAQPTTHR
ncbi:protein-tyrosine-phosphatase [Actinomadura sp. NBRC 104425]|uniref:ABC transporter ATP-binding protein n=1 Tax=Actinomadura sp. NBRC 104425 TaxID=3032204 RepID=UPI0024A08FD2|nr:ABC transporter ATP-binding protein [Actinomadura sp. NBRC 104425]GLZ13440.1 protein-tyrosine-phosphatase [Actinomadura sp. NBRC 104425]